MCFYRLKRELSPTTHGFIFIKFTDLWLYCWNKILKAEDIQCWSCWHHPQPEVLQRVTLHHSEEQRIMLMLANYWKDSGDIVTLTSSCRCCSGALCLNVDADVACGGSNTSCRLTSTRRRTLRRADIKLWSSIKVCLMQNIILSSSEAVKCWVCRT